MPPTLVRDGPAGRGMVQLWIETDDDTDILRMILTRDDRLRRMCVFDALVNNADRKGGHVLVTEDGVHGCDHGICFAVEPKLRTVLWGWRGDRSWTRSGRCWSASVAAIDGDLGERLAPLLDPAEIDALRSRAVSSCCRTAACPIPDPYRHVVPWPPF